MPELSSTGAFRIRKRHVALMTSFHSCLLYSISCESQIMALSLASAKSDKQTVIFLYQMLQDFPDLM